MKAVNPCGLKRAALINDLSCFGKCSLSVSMPILSSYGIETVPLPTALLSTHTGGFTGYVVQDTTEAMRAFAAHWKQVGVQFDCIATGYCCSPEQIRLAAEFIRSFADERTLVVVDPVLGDHGRLYSGFTDAHVDAMRELCSLADVITPKPDGGGAALGPRLLQRGRDASLRAAGQKHHSHQRPHRERHRLSCAAGRRHPPRAAALCRADAARRG